MSKKLQDYVKRLKKFLEENYITHPLKMYNYSSKTVETKENYFAIETKNAGLVMIHPDLWTCDKPYKYDLFTQKYCYEWDNEKEKTFKFRTVYDGKFEKNNIYAKPCIDDIEFFISSEYRTTIPPKGFMCPAEKVTKEEYYLLKSVADFMAERLKNKFDKMQDIGTHTQGLFEYDFYKNNKYIAGVEILSGNKLAILLSNQIARERTRFFVSSLEEAKTKINQLIK